MDDTDDLARTGGLARWFVRVVDFLWAGFAATLIAAVALVTIVRMLLPEIGTQRAAIESWLSATVGRPAKVGAIEASWNGWAPRISVTHLALLDPLARNELVHFDRAVINIAPLGSLVARTLKPKSLVLSGVELTLLRHLDGHFSIAGMPATKSPVLNWLLEQDNFAVTEADLTVIDERGGSSFALSDLMLTVRARAARTLLTAYVDLPDAIGERLALEVSGSANPLSPDWSGTLDLRLEGIESAFVFEHLAAWPAPAPPPAAIDLVARSEWRAGRLEQALFDVAVARPGAGGDTAHALLSSRGMLERRGQGWRLALTDLALPDAEQSTGTPRVSVAWSTAAGSLEHLVARAEHVPLAPLVAVLGTLAPAGGRLGDILHTSAPYGRVEQLELAWAPEQAAGPRFFVDARLAAVDLAAGPRTPAITDLDARLVAQYGRGWLGFSAEELQLRDAERLTRPLEVEALDGHLAWHSADDGTLALTTQRLHGQVGAAELVLDGTLALPRDTAARADLTLDFATSDAASLHELVPRGLMPARGESWMREVLQAGRLSAGQARLEGTLGALPTRTDGPELHMTAEISEATLKYARDWPVASAFSGHLVIDGRTVELAVHDGRIAGASIAGAVITLPNLYTHKRVVRISGTARGPAASATAIVLGSPLKRSKAVRLTEIDIDGDIEVALDLNLALYPDGPRDVLGQARFNGNRIVSRKHEITLDKVVGTVGFTRGDWYGEDLRAEFDGNAVGLVVNGGLDDPNYDSEFRLTGTSPAAGLLRYIERYTPPLHAWLEQHAEAGAISGELPWKAVFTVPSEQPAGSPLPSRLTLESSLQGLAIDLPWPFGKSAAEARLLRIETEILDHVALATAIHFGDSFDAEIDAVRSAAGGARLERVEVLFGSTAPEFTGQPGLSLSGHVPLLPLGEWARVLNRGTRAAPSRLGELPQQFDVQVKELHTLGRQFADVRLHGQRGATHWEVEVSGQDAAGRIRIPRDIERDTLHMDFERLHLARVVEPEQAEQPADAAIDPRRLPALEFNCASFKFGDADLGKAAIVTRRLDNGQRIERIAFNTADFAITADGDWLLHDGAHGSHFEIAVTSHALADLLERFGYNTANIKDGKTRIAIDANWAGMPSDFTLARMNGTFELHVTDGRFLDIEPGSGRLFGLLSLQTLPRRLSFDFDDLFRKGFAFDTIDGVFEVESGNAYTNGLLMEGPAARIDVSGRTGLGAKDYDQRVVVTPALSNTLPLAGALFGPIGAGAGAVVFIGQKMFKSIPEQINRLLSREYTITGSWDNPVVERI